MKNRKKLKAILIFLFMKIVAYSSMDIGMYSLNINRKIKTNSTKVYITEEDELYVNLANILYTLGIRNNRRDGDKFIIDESNQYNQEKTIDLKSKKIKGKKNINYDNEIIVDNEEILVKVEFLKEVLDLEEIERNDNLLLINLKTGFTLPIELENIRKYQRENLESEKKENIEQISSKSKFFEPGNLRTIYTYNKQFQSQNQESKYIDMEYLGSTLYGTLEAYYNVYPELKKNQIRLIYEDIYKNHSLIFGDMSPKLPSLFSGTTGNIKGISFVNDYKTNTEIENNILTVSGYAPTGKVVELYRNGKLLDYVDVKNGQYEFKNIPVPFFSDRFSLIIYNVDGTIKREDLKRYYGEQPEKKGEYSFNLYSGESTDTGFNQLIGEINYGLTSNLTLRTGYYDLKYNATFTSINPQEDQIGKVGLLYVSDYGVAPYNIELNYFVDKNQEKDIIYKYNHVYEDYRIGFQGGNYSKKTEKRINKKSEYSLDISKDKLNFISKDLGVSLNYYKVDYSLNNPYEEIGATLRGNYNLLTPEYSIYKNTMNGDILHDVSMRSYYFKNYTVYFGVSHRTLGEENELKYRAEILTRYKQSQFGKFKVFYEKSNKYGDIAGVSFDIDYESWLSGTANYTKVGGTSNLQTGFTVDKIVNLSDLRKNITSLENGILKGIVYLDLDDDGIYTKGVDQVLPKSKVRIDGKQKMTDENGYYEVSDVSSSGTHELKVTSQNPLYKMKVDKYLIKTKPASKTDINIPMYTQKVILGSINFSSEEVGMKLIDKIFLNIIDKKTKEKKDIIIPESDGFFIIENIAVGDYEIQVENVEQPNVIIARKDVKLTSKDKEIEVTVEVGGV